AYVIDVDKISREVVEPGSPGWQEVVEVFGDEILNPDQTINRKKLGDIIFSDAEKRKKLEEIIHPKIYTKKQKLINEIEGKDRDAIIIIDIPLLIEVKQQKTVDKVILVYVSPQIQIERLINRDGFSVEEAQKRLAAQLPIKGKKKYADYVINNESSPEVVQKEVKEIFQALKAEAQKKKISG
ncbi:MAG: dephospho-CoA kinase, partial [Desulfobacterota bacterium]|nr:dephospho-CoA kinase [Thermodesulfobacteriota bacterium]